MEDCITIKLEEPVFSILTVEVENHESSFHTQIESEQISPITLQVSEHQESESQGKEASIEQISRTDPLDLESSFNDREPPSKQGTGTELNFYLTKSGLGSLKLENQDSGNSAQV